ncbi:MAG: putative capsular polysaccharide synthesis family protein [Pseudomonadota bacterium]
MRTPIVYTMGKVASSAISTAIRRTGRLVHDIHTLNDETLMREMRKAVDENRFPNPHFCVSMAWKAREITIRQRAVYISLVRDPVARNISAYFQNLWRFVDKLDGGDRAEVDAYVDDFINRYPHHFPVNWYDREYKEFLDIDIYAGVFRTQNGYQLSHHERVVIFRVDTPDEVKSRILTKVLGFDVEVQRANEAAEKAYSDDYEAVRALVQLEAPLLDQIYGSQFVRHFWDDDEIEAMRARWLAPNSQI